MLRRDAKDAKILLTQSYFLVLNRMNNDYIKDLIFLNQFNTTPPQVNLQNSVIICIKEKQYEWLNMTIEKDKDKKIR